MTPEQIHDALTLLPGDLIAEADRRRSGRGKIILWKRYAAMAASVVLVLGCFGAVHHTMGLKGAGKPEFTAAAQAPMAMQAESNSIREAPEAAADREVETPAEAAPQDALCGLPTAPTEAGSSLSAGHAHGPAQIRENQEPAAICGNIEDASVSFQGETWTLSGDAARELTWLLHSLEYKEEALCRCLAPYRVDTELGSGYEISLDQYFVRIAGAQAALTEEQTQTLARLLGA